MKRFAYVVVAAIFLLGNAPVWGGDLAVFIDAGDTEGLIKSIEDANAGTGPDLIFIRIPQGGQTDFVFTKP